MSIQERTFSNTDIGITTKFQHFILTQFNLRNFPKSNNSEYANWVSWTKERIALFKKYCLQSVLDQSENNFTWILYFDKATPDEFSLFLDELQTYPNLVVYFCDGSEGFNKTYMQPIMERLNEDIDWVITSRIDNDDAVHRDMVRVLQNAIVFKHRFMISLSSGYTFEERSAKLSHYFYPMAPFLTIIEKKKDAKGIFEKGHTEWPGLRLWILKEIWLDWFAPKSRKVRFILSRPLWLQIIHKTNVSNSFYRGFPVIKKLYLKDFGLSLETSKSDLTATIKYRNYVVWKRYFKSFVVKLVTKKI